MRPIFTSMVAHSDHEPLLDWFTALPCPTLFVYGEQNSTLSYLPTLHARGVGLAEINRSGHFPQYSNAPEFWDRLSDFIVGAEVPSED